MNSTLSGATQANIVLLVLMTVASAVVNCRAARRGLQDFTAMMWAATLLSLLYLVAYLILLFTDTSAGKWSNTIKPLSDMAWPLVWIWPAVVVLRISKQMGKMSDLSKDAGDLDE